MYDFDEALALLQTDIVSLAALRKQRVTLMESTMQAGAKTERVKVVDASIATQETLALATLHNLVDFPPHHTRHLPKIDEFHQDGSFEKSVFIMTKFPDAKAAKAKLDAELDAVIQAARDAVTKAGFTPRVASDKHYHPVLWDNVELYLLGCRRGIAIVEKVYAPKLNPNVAMEWGWMRAMGRPVLYLVQKGAKPPADWQGLLQTPFDWADPVPGISKGVADWLK